MRVNCEHTVNTLSTYLPVRSLVLSNAVAPPSDTLSTH